MKKTLLYLTILFLSLPVSNAQSITITESSGWLETAFIEWTPIVGVDSYNVYYTGMGVTNQIIDIELIRSYGSYYRADILGLAAGSYTLKIVPVTANVEGTATISNSLTVLPHERNGFAHNGGAIPGAYNLDGTLKNNAVILYITQNSKNTVSLNVTGASKNPYIGLQTILDGFRRGNDNRPLAVRLIGNITDLTYMLKGNIVIENKNNSITFEGVGEDAVANGWGLLIKRTTNLEIRNLGFMLTDGVGFDAIGLQNGNSHVWVHNCDLFYGSSGPAVSNQEKGDGAVDIKDSNYLTVSYNHFWDSGKTCLLGINETTTELYVTYHHNWFDHSDSRHPRVVFFTTHIYNNYYDGNSKVGVSCGNNASLFVEGNTFRNPVFPIVTARQGSRPNGLSGLDGAVVKAFNNDISDERNFIAYNASSAPIQFDAYVATTRDEVLNSSIRAFQGGFTYNNFDTNPALYVNSLIIDSPLLAKDKVMKYSGRVSGGDISWTFNNSVDDSSSLVNTGLKALLTSYRSQVAQTLTPANNNQAVDSGSAITDMVFTWGGGATNASVSGLPIAGISYAIDPIAQTITVSGTPTVNVYFSITTNGTSGTPITASGAISINNIPGDEIHNVTVSGLSNTFYTITGTTINSVAASRTYDGLTLTKRFKVQSSMNIAYTTASVSTLTLVFDPDFSGPIRLDGTTYNATSGLLTIPDIPTGTHNITRLTGTNLYYMKTQFTNNDVFINAYEFIPSQYSSALAGYTTTIGTSDGNSNSCTMSVPKNNVWFKFTALSKDQSIFVLSNDKYGSLKKPILSLWDATGKTEITCNQGVTKDKAFINVDNLTVGETYYVSVGNTNTNEAGTFSLFADASELQTKILKIGVKDAGLIRYNNSLNKFQGWNGTQWLDFN